MCVPVCARGCVCDCQTKQSQLEGDLVDKGVKLLANNYTKMLVLNQRSHTVKFDRQIISLSWEDEHALLPGFQD